LLGLTLWLGPASAQPSPASPPAEAPTADIGVSLLPREDGETLSYFLYRLAPGQWGEDRIEVGNYSRQTQVVNIYASDCQNTEDGGLNGPLLGEANHELGKWVELSEKRLTLGPGETRSVSLRLTIPEGLPVRDYFGFVFVQPEVEEQKAVTPSNGKVSFAIKVQTRYGVTLVAKIPGPDKEDLAVEPPRKSLEQGKLKLSFGLHNRGNRYLKPSGAWQLIGPKGEAVAQAATDAWGYLLPDSKMVQSIPLQTNRPLVRGLYTLKVQVSPREDAPPQSAEFPLQLP
jgi:hypothetical protein